MTLRSITFDSFTHFLLPRPLTAQKGDFGHVLIVGGDRGMAGAVRLAGQAALRVGAGIVTLATHPSHAMTAVATCPEILCYGIKSPKALKPLLQKATVVIVGPGLGQSRWSSQLWKTVITKKPSSLVVDADALNLLAKKPKIYSNWILTPHPGEAARLLNSTIQAVQADRPASAKAVQGQFGGVCVLKGAGSLIVDIKGESFLCTEGNPGMATAGMGDVLSGVIGGLLAQKIPSAVAAALGVCLHAKAGDLAAASGERGLIASDLFSSLRFLVNPSSISSREAALR